MEPDRIRVRNVDIRWDPTHGTCFFQDHPAVTLWLDTTLTALMSAIQTVAGTERLLLALQLEGRKSVDNDWDVISAHPDFASGFRALAQISAVAGWGTWELVDMDSVARTCVFRARNTWEGLSQKSLGVCWGSAFLAGKLAGCCTRLFGESCWADQTSFIARGDAHDAFTVKPSERSLDREIDNLHAMDQATRADMATALRRLELEIAERRKAETALRESEERWQYALEGAGDGVWDWNPLTDQLFFSTRYKEMLGYTDSEIANTVREWETRIHPDDHDRVLAEVDRHLEGRTPAYLSEYRARCKDGTYKWILGRGRVVSRTPDGSPLRMIGTHADLTTVKEAEAALRQSEARFRTLVETSRDWIWAVNTEGRLTYTNDRVRDILGIEPADLMKLRFDQLMHPEDAAAIPALRQNAIATRAGWTGRVFRWRHRDGSWRWLESSSAPLVGSDGALLGFQGIDRDITERMRAETERIELERSLLHAQKLESLGILAGGIAHDFNNLLMAIRGNLELAAMEAPVAAPCREGIDHALSATHRAADLTRQMLAYAGKGRFVIAGLDLNDFVRENATLFRSAVPRSISIVLRPSPSPCRVRADAGQIQQVIMNLITNAAESLGEAEGLVSVSTGTEWYDAARLAQSRLTELPEPGSYAYVQVADTGCGMTEETARRMFEPFFSTKAAGRGLGMAALLGVVRGHRGAVLVSSAPNAGTTIRVLLPSAEGGETAAPEQTGTQPEAVEHVREPGGLVLVVDDEQPIRDLCAGYLRRIGYRAISAPDGDKALDLYRERGHEIQCVLLDLSMPVRDGISTFLELRRQRPDAKVILCSGYDEEDSVDPVASRGLAGYLQKPYGVAQLREALRRALGDPPGGAPGSSDPPGPLPPEPAG